MIRKATCLVTLIFTLVALPASQAMTSLAVPTGTWIMDSIWGADFQRALDVAGSINTAHIIDTGSIERLSLISLQPKIDTEPPTIFIVSPNPGEVVKWSTVTVAWSAIDDISGIGHYEIALDYGLWINVRLNNTHEFYDLKDGVHTVSVRAFDLVGNMAETRFEFTVATSSFPLPDYVYGAIFVGIIIIAAGITLYVVGQKGLLTRRVTRRRLVR